MSTADSTHRVDESTVAWLRDRIVDVVDGFFDDPSYALMTGVGHTGDEYAATLAQAAADLRIELDEVSAEHATPYERERVEGLGITFPSTGPSGNPGLLGHSTWVWAQEQVVEAIEEFFDDPIGVIGGVDRSATHAHVTELRQLAVSVGVDYGAVVASNVSRSERERVERILADGSL